MEWISVKERLPETDSSFLVAGRDRYVTVADWYAAEQRWDLSREDKAIGVSSATITHWMPLPEPPEQSEQMQAALARSAERLKDIPVSGETKEPLEMIRRARDGEMWGSKPTED